MRRYGQLMRDWIGSVFADEVTESWARRFLVDGQVGLLRETLNVAAGRPATEALESFEGQEALGAAEVVAAAAGDPARVDTYPEGLLAWAGDHPDAGDDRMRALSRTAVERAAGARSELSDRWEASDELRERHLVIELLLHRLRG